MNGAWHKQLKFPLNKLSLTQSALGSHGVDKQGSGTDSWYSNTKSHANSSLIYFINASSVPEQLNPFPSVNGDWQRHVKLSVSSPPLTQMALTSQGSLRHGSGTTFHMSGKVSLIHSICHSCMHITCAVKSISLGEWSLAETTEVSTQQTLSHAKCIRVTR